VPNSDLGKQDDRPTEPKRAKMIPPDKKGVKNMWDFLKTLAKGAAIGLAIRLALDIYAELTKPKDERILRQGQGEGQT
jgi:hypothetical protein